MQQQKENKSHRLSTKARTGNVRSEVRAINLGPHFKLTKTGLEITGDPSIDQWSGVGSALCYLEKSVPYAIGDWLVYGEDRDDWRERLDQAIAMTGLSYKTLQNHTYISRHVEEPERQLAPTLSHAAEVAQLTRPEQTEWLAQAKAEDWTRQELRQHIRTAKRTRIIEGQAKLEGMFRVVYADPPYAYRQNRATETGEMTRADEVYPSMTMEAIAKLPVAAHVLPNAVLFLWVPPAMLLESPGPREIIEGWGFEYRTNYCWDKVLGMPGSYSYVRHEHLLVATRGSGTPDIAIEGAHHDSVQTFRREGEHSEKPEAFRTLIKHLYPTGPYLELFAREKHAKWHCFGNDVRLWK